MIFFLYLSQKELKDLMAQYPVPEELTQCVTWEVMQAALISERQKIQEARPAVITPYTARSQFSVSCSFQKPITFHSHTKSHRFLSQSLFG